MGFYDGYERKQGFYLGDHFDSQLEGQWARFFHLALTLRGYRRCNENGGDYFGLGCGLRYRPDFYLPNIRFIDSDQVGSYVEVKPRMPDDRSMEKMIRLCSIRCEKMILVMGSPINTQINNIADDDPRSAWVIDGDGHISANNRFVETIDRNGVPAVFVTEYQRDGLFIKNNFITEAERAGMLRFHEDGSPALNDDRYECNESNEIPFVPW